MQRRSVDWKGELTPEQIKEVMGRVALPDAPQHLPKPTQGLHNGLMQRRSVDWKGELTPEQLSEVMNGKSTAGEVQKSDPLPASANGLRNALVQKRSDNEAELAKAMEQKEKSDILPAPAKDLRNALVQRRSVEWKHVDEAELMRAMNELENEVEEKRAIVQEEERATRGETKGGSSLRRMGVGVEGVASPNLEEAIEEFVRTTGTMPTESDIRALLGLDAEEDD